MIFGNKERMLYGNRFNGTKGNGYQPIKKVMTNEEWLRSATTEQLAEFLFSMAYMCSYCGDEAHSSQEKMQQCHFGKCGCQRKDWLKWLKQPHQSVTVCNE